MGLVLSVAEFSDTRRWRWLLAEEDTGRPLADHEMDLGGSEDEYLAFTDLYRYLRWNAVPDRRSASEADIVARVGAWAGEQVLGSAIGEAIAAAAPVTVRVEVPVQAGFLSGWPLELAYAGGAPLAKRGDVTFVYDLAPVTSQSGVGGRSAGPATLRMLAVFSLPTQTSVLALRRERFELARLVRRIGARQRRRIELAIAQYGVTRAKLAEITDSGDGWDVLHLSGHGGRGQFLLEQADGSPDSVDTDELMGLLGPLRRRVQLAVVSACESAAATTAETLRWVGLEEQAIQLEEQDAAGLGSGPASAGSSMLTGIARALVERLECAVVAMRYPVTDEFAIALTGDLYDRVLGRGQNLGAALARAVPQAAGLTPSPARPAICLATPVLAGPGAATLRLQAPAGPPLLDPAAVRMERFPAEPERFVGRAQAMARSSAALAAGSGRTGVMLHGMAGSGKTACALELAYRHQDSFQAAAFWQAPEQADEFTGALAGLAAALEIQLGGYRFAMADHITTSQAVAAFAPRLARLLEDNGILLVLDNLETLLTAGGVWRDPRWTPLIEALTGHRGESRVIMTSRTPPAQLPGGVLVLPVHALALDESAALARELPHLRALLHADASPQRDVDPAAMAADRGLVRRVLHVVQGHPKMMELADASAADPGRLADQLSAAEGNADGQALDAFFRDGTTGLSAAQFLDALTGWTATTLAALPESAQLLAQFLACLEDSDRQSAVIDGNWADVWRRLGRPGEPPRWQPPATALAAAALIQSDQSPGQAGDQEMAVLYRMHPGIAQTIRATASPDIQAATDTELAAFWIAIASQAMSREGGEAGGVVVTAGLGAAPYLLRLEEWLAASSLLTNALNRDSSPGTMQVILPLLRVIAATTGDSSDLAYALLQAHQAGEAERLLRVILNQAIADRDFKRASNTAGHLATATLAQGRLREALDLNNRRADYADSAGLGTWEQLSIGVQRLQILTQLGEHHQVLGEIADTLTRINELPSQTEAEDSLLVWNTREMTLNIGFASAFALGEYQQALDFSQELVASMRARGASAYDLAYNKFNDYAPLRRLGRLDDAERVLVECQKVFEGNDDLDQLGNVFGARATLEATRGNPASAVTFQKTATRYHYLRLDPEDIAKGHDNLASYLLETGSDRLAQLAHRLAAAVIYQLAGMAYYLSSTMEMLAREFREAERQQLPGTIQEIIEVVEQTEGVKFRELITTLAPNLEDASAALAEVLEMAARMPSSDDSEIQRTLREWEPVIAVAVAAAGADHTAAAALEPTLEQMENSQDWAALVAVLRRIVSGERGEQLLEGLDPIDTAIAGQILFRLTPSDAGSQS